VKSCPQFLSKIVVVELQSFNGSSTLHKSLQNFLQFYGGDYCRKLISHIRIELQSFNGTSTLHKRLQKFLQSYCGDYCRKLISHIRIAA